MAEQDLPKEDGSPAALAAEEERRQVIAEYARSLREVLNRLRKVLRDKLDG